MIIKKLYKSIMLIAFVAPCMASEFDVFQYRLRNEGGSFLIESGVIKSFSPKDLPTPGYVEKEEENAYISIINDTTNAERITIDVFERCRGAACKAVSNGYQIVLKFLFESAQNYPFFATFLGDFLIIGEFKKLDDEFPGIYEYVRKISSPISKRK